VNAIAWFVGIGIILVGVAAVFERARASRQARLGRLICKYGDYGVANRVFQRQVWQGQTEKQLLDSIGRPAGVDREQLETRKRETWKYRPRGLSGHGLRITLENGQVTAWDQN